MKTATHVEKHKKSASSTSFYVMNISVFISVILFSYIPSKVKSYAVKEFLSEQPQNKPEKRRKLNKERERAKEKIESDWKEMN